MRPQWGDATGAGAGAGAGTSKNGASQAIRLARPTTVTEQLVTAATGFRLSRTSSPGGSWALLDLFNTVFLRLLTSYLLQIDAQSSC
mmetsp:Transcript_14119/g.42521  ORF Transcript_14119/g.42521 Transcript_14119/m.42521 type:complete len:87 (+) Transcript_14119:820-1080(+)